MSLTSGPGGDAEVVQRAAPSAVIDVHAHHVPRTVIDEVRAHGTRYGIEVHVDDEGDERLAFADGFVSRPFIHSLGDLHDRLAMMDRTGVDVQVLSTWTDIAAYHLPARLGARWCRLQNEALSEAAATRPARFLAMGTLPLQDATLAGQEMQHCVDHLGMRSFVLGTNVNGGDLDDAAFLPLWSLACDLDVLVFLHPPARQIGFDRLHAAFLNNLVGNPAETTIAAAKLILAGVPLRFPALKCLLAHGGGFLPYQAGRLDRGHVVGATAPAALSGELPSEFVSWFYYDTLVFDDGALAYLLNRVSPDRVVLGSDYPFEMRDDDAVARVRRSGLAGDALDAVLGRTTGALLRTGCGCAAGTAAGRGLHMAEQTGHPEGVA